MRTRRPRCTPAAILPMAAMAIGATIPGALRAQTDPHRMSVTGMVSPRFESYNIEMVEVIGGRFWKPYGATPIKDMPAPSGLVGMDPALYEQRKPIDLDNPRLRKLAAALGPAYVRVSGSWANTVYFQDSDAATPAALPQGFGGVLTRAEWRGVSDFAKAVHAEIVTSFGVTTGDRNADGVWQPEQAIAFLRYSNSIGAPIAAAEFFNEPTFARIAGMGSAYSGASYARDFAAFRPVFRKYEPNAVLLGPGSVGEGAPLAGNMMQMLPTKDMLQSGGGVGIDAFSYHFYPAVSERCAAHAPASAHMGTSPAEALSDSFLSTTNTVEQFYAGLRDEYTPGKPMWLTETGQAACGGDRWAATYLDTFRYLYQMGSLARRDVQVVMHNTLAASDYGLIDERTLQPRPDYWAALLWHNLMGTTVLDAGANPDPKVKVFAQCTRDKPGDVTVLALNVDAAGAKSLVLPERSERYSLTASEPTSKAVDLNGTVLQVAADGDVPATRGASEAKGSVQIAPLSVNFFVVDAKNPACK